MNLTNKQIEELYKFTRQHYVSYYDVQTELVDHLANDIEEIWIETPKLSFEEARDKSFKKFGVFGFMDVISSKQKALNKRYHKLLWRFVKEWFILPKIILTLTIFLLTYITFRIDNGYFIFVSILIILGIIDVILAYKLKRKSKQRFAKKNKKWMLEEIIFNTGSASTILIVSNMIQIEYWVANIESEWTQLLFSFLITLAIIYSYVSLIVIPNKVEELLTEEYPEYKII